MSITTTVGVPFAENIIEDSRAGREQALADRSLSVFRICMRPPGVFDNPSITLIY